MLCFFFSSLFIFVQILQFIANFVNLFSQCESILQMFNLSALESLFDFFFQLFSIDFIHYLHSRVRVTF